MSKPKIPNQKKQYSGLDKRIARYAVLVRSIYDTLNLEAAKLAVSLGLPETGGAPFSFADYPETKKRIADIQGRFVEDIHAVIYRGTSEEWKNSNGVQDLLADKVLAAYGAQANGERRNALYQANSDALAAFQSRRDKGLGLSDKLWKQSAAYKKELEDAISCAIGKGTDAVTLSKRISKYLLDFPRLQKDYKEKFGTASRASDCEYRSLRLAASEINMAYRTAENERWGQMDFVVGYEIKLSSNHNCKGVPDGSFHDICDQLAGKYPKDFEWTGWHPCCRCYKVPILKTEEEFWEWDGRSESTTESVNEVKDVPDDFKKWVLDNQDRISAAKRRGTLPYFLRDNKSSYQEVTVENSVAEIVNRALFVGNEIQSIAERIAIRNNGYVTKANFKSSASITRKVTTERITPYDIKDAVRTTIIVSKSKIEDVLEELHTANGFLRIKKQNPESFMGYSGNIVNIKATNGLIAEIQVNTEKMIYAKEKPADAKRILGKKRWEEIHNETGMEGGLGHKYYEEWRVLEKTSEKALEIAKKSAEYYSHFQ